MNDFITIAEFAKSINHSENAVKKVIKRMIASEEFTKGVEYTIINQSGQNFTYGVNPMLVCDKVNKKRKQNNLPLWSPAILTPDVGIPVAPHDEEDVAGHGQADGIPVAPHSEKNKVIQSDYNLHNGTPQAGHRQATEINYAERLINRMEDQIEELRKDKDGYRGDYSKSTDAVLEAQKNYNALVDSHAKEKETLLKERLILETRHADDRKYIEKLEETVQQLTAGNQAAYDDAEKVGFEDIKDAKIEEDVTTEPSPESEKEEMEQKPFQNFESRRVDSKPKPSWFPNVDQGDNLETS